MVTQDSISVLVYLAAWLAAILTGLATAYWVAIVADGNYCWAAFGFTLGIAMPLGGATLLLGVIPSSCLYMTKRRRRDWLSLVLTGSSFLIVLVEALFLSLIIPQRGE